jgi:hypothetical protein
MKLLCADVDSYVSEPLSGAASAKWQLQGQCFRAFARLVRTSRVIDTKIPILCTQPKAAISLKQSAQWSLPFINKALERVGDEQADHSISFVARLLLQASYRHCSIVVVRLYLRSFQCLSGERVFSGNSH